MTLLLDNQHTYEEYTLTLATQLNQQLQLDTDVTDWSSVDKYNIFNSKLDFELIEHDKNESVQSSVPAAENKYELELYTNTVTHAIVTQSHKTTLRTIDCHVITWKQQQSLQSIPINLSELSNEQYHRFYKHHFSTLLLSQQQGTVHNISINELSITALYVLQGIDTQYIQYSEQLSAYVIADTLTAIYSTQHSIYKLLQHYIKYGTIYRHLELLAQYMQVNYKSYGSIVLAFSNAIAQWLSTYRAKLLTLHTHNLTLLQLHTTTKQLLHQLGAIYNIVLQNKTYNTFNVQTIVNKLPKKTLLITYFYNQCLSLSIQDTYNIYGNVLYIFNTCTTAYINILASWMYQGKRIDPFNEFFNDNTSSKTLNSNILLNIPVFLQPITDILFLTGQSLYVMSHADTALFYSCAINTMSPIDNQPVSGLQLLQLHYTNDNIQQQAYLRQLVKTQQQDALDNYTVQLRDQLQYGIEQRLQTQQSLLQQRKLLTDGSNDTLIAHKQQLELLKQQQYLYQLNEQIAINKAKRQAEQQAIAEAERQAEQQYLAEQHAKIAAEQQRVVDEYNAAMKIEWKKQQLLQWKAKRLALNEQRTDLLNNNQHTELDSDSIVHTIDPDAVIDTDDIELLVDDSETVAEIALDVVDVDKIKLVITSPTKLKPTKTVTDSPVLLSAERTANRTAQMSSNIFNITDTTESQFVNQPVKATNKQDVLSDVTNSQIKRITPLDAARQAIVPLSTTVTNKALLPVLKVLEEPNTDVIDAKDNNSDVTHSLQSIIQQTIVASVLTQYDSVNRAVLTLYNTQLHLMQHIQTCRQYLLWCSGDVSQYICHELCELVQYNRLTQLSYSSLKSLIDDALKYCQVQQTQYTENLYFKQCDTQHTNKSTQNHELHNMDNVVLTYKTQWPISLVITDESLTQYNRIWSYLLRMKRVHNKLTDVFKIFQSAEKSLHQYRIEHTQQLLQQQRTRQQINQSTGNINDNIIDKNVLDLYAYRLRILQTARHEMQHLHTVLLQHTLNEILDTSWNDYITNISNVSNLRDLCYTHDTYMEHLLKHCYLHSSTIQLYNIIDTVLCDIYDFCGQCTHIQINTIDITSDNNIVYESLCQRAARFRQTTSFLYTVLRDINQNNTTLQSVNQLLIRLDFSGYYEKQDKERYNTETM